MDCMFVFSFQCSKCLKSQSFNNAFCVLVQNKKESPFLILYVPAHFSYSCHDVRRAIEPVLPRVSAKEWRTDNEEELKFLPLEGVAFHSKVKRDEFLESVKESLQKLETRKNQEVP